ncbi:hypothetical protein AB834_02770 [PVC group bacterium (ex Bugula neritina AB1)]|nr:hypothetical protein AB834_02770 [PVC group bacterium (ex Bugula neritina AB1)]
MDFAIGIDLGGTFIKGGVISQKGECLLEKSTPTESHLGGETIFKNIRHLCQNLRDEFSEGTIKSMGIGTPGLVDQEKGGVVSGAHNLPGWLNFPFIHLLKADFSLPVFAHNDVTMMTYGEYLIGAGKGATNLICITLGTGIGGGFILNKSLYEGSSKYAGEVGHMKIRHNGRSCTCGSKGCWEAHASASALVQRAKEKKIYKENENSGKIIFEKVKQKDPASIKLLKSYISDLALGVSNLLNIFNPDIFVIGGGLSGASNQFFEPLQKKVQDKTMEAAFNACCIKPAILGNKAGMIGSALFSLNQS